MTLRLRASGQSALSCGARITAVLFVLSMFLLPQAAQGQDIAPPLSFADPEPLIVTWPASIRVTVHNDTTDRVAAIVQVTNLTDPDTGAVLLAAEALPNVPPAIELAPAGELNLTLPLATVVQPESGAYVGYIVFSVPNRGTVLRKQITIVVPEVVALALPVPAVETWTLNALRILPFLNPVCLRGFAIGCTLPVYETDGMGFDARLSDAQPMLGYVTNERGGGIAVRLKSSSATQSAATAEQESVLGGLPASPSDPMISGAVVRLTAPTELSAPASGNARLKLSFDRAYGLIPHWGLTGVYQGTLRFASDNEGAIDQVNLKVRVKDILIWPILVMILGVWSARKIQRHLTVHRDTLDLLNRLDAASREFGQLRKSIYGYNVGEDFLARHQELENRIRNWERSHYGPLTPADRERFVRTILTPLSELESQVAVWATFRQRLDRLRRKMEYVAKPALQRTEPPAGLTVEIKSGGLPYVPEPRFYTAARGLLQGSRLELAEVPELALQLDQAADIAAVWGQYDQMVSLVRDGLRQLYNPTVELSLSEEALLEQARGHLNSAVHDLWEARNLPELKERETRTELIEARDILQRLLDPFVYYAGADTLPQADSNPDSVAAVNSSFPTPAATSLRPIVRSYARLNTYDLPAFDVTRSVSANSQPSTTLAVDAQQPQRPSFLGERMVLGAAIVMALIAGLNRYATTQFGTLADYLALFTWSFAIKIVLELANLAASVWITKKSG